MQRRLIILTALIGSSITAVIFGILANAATASLLPRDFNSPLLLALTIGFAIISVGSALLQLLYMRGASRRRKEYESQLLSAELTASIKESSASFETDSLARMRYYLATPARRAGISFNGRQLEMVHMIAADLQQEAILEGYCDLILELLMVKETPEFQWDQRVRHVIQARTMMVLRRLGPTHKSILVRFIYESGLIDKDNPLIDLHKANLSKVDLSGISLSRANFTLADLGKANLSEAHLESADLRGAKLNGVNLSGANLHGANLIETMLSGADLSHAKLLNAQVTSEQLLEARSLEGAIMPDGSTHH